jgi:hypothetical protein
MFEGKLGDLVCSSDLIYLDSKLAFVHEVTPEHVVLAQSIGLRKRRFANRWVRAQDGWLELQDQRNRPATLDLKRSDS